MYEEDLELDIVKSRTEKNQLIAKYGKKSHEELDAKMV